MQKMSLSQTITEIKNMIEKGEGDAGRLYFILECLKNKKNLYHSDHKYLESKLESSISLEDESREDRVPHSVLEKIQNLINDGIGDPGRLQYIYDSLAKGKALYHSDQMYLERKLNEDVVFESDDMVTETSVAKPSEKTETTIKSQPVESKPKSIPSMPKDWNKSELNNNLDDKIKEEQNKIEKQKTLSQEIGSQKSKLSQLRSQRQEYEQKINKEKSLIESQIQEERRHIETQVQLSDEITQQKKELDKVRSERNNVIKK